MIAKIIFGVLDKMQTNDIDARNQQRKGLSTTIPCWPIICYTPILIQYMGVSDTLNCSTYIRAHHVKVALIKKVADQIWAEAGPS